MRIPLNNRYNPSHLQKEELTLQDGAPELAKLGKKRWLNSMVYGRTFQEILTRMRICYDMLLFENRICYLLQENNYNRQDAIK